MFRETSIIDSIFLVDLLYTIGALYLGYIWYTFMILNWIQYFSPVSWIIKGFIFPNANYY